MGVQQMTATKAQILDGTACANQIKEELAAQVKKLTDMGLRPPGLAVLLIGEDPASQVYVKNKVTACKKTGIESLQYNYPADIDLQTVLDKIAELNADEKVDAILVQLPLPKHLSTEKILMAISPAKDADGLHAFNAGLLFTAKPGPRPCTPKGIMTLLERNNIPLEGKHAVVIGRSNLVGKPVSIMLQEKNCTVTMCHSRTKDLDAIARQAELLVVAIGKPQMVKGTWIRPGAVVIDVGIHRQEKEAGGSKLVGDVAFDEAAPVASYITPVPGGIGPMTIAMLLTNTFNAYKSRVTPGAAVPA
jgi:methylenetetrahydrofolate dehydrogenase (NADP+) / methenyltetrahydrofolate cyclohydrolase